MDRIGIFAMGAAFVLASALHMVGAAGWLIVVPVALFVVGAVRLLVMREAHDGRADLSRSSVTEG